MKKYLALMLALVLTLSLSFAIAENPDDYYLEITFSNVFQPTEYNYKASEMLAQMITERTEGHITVTYYGQNQLDCYGDSVAQANMGANWMGLEEPSLFADYVGDAAVLIGAKSGRFPDMGYTIPGEMGGLWAGEYKVCDGFFFAIDDVPLVSADCCEAHPVATAFHYRMQEQEMHMVRRQYIPDGVKGCVIELTVENQKNVPRMVEVSFTVRTDCPLMPT